MTIELQKRVADEVLTRIESIDPNCIIIGGAPRDWFLQKECNDLDVFVTGGTKHVDEHIKKLFGATRVKVNVRDASNNHTGVNIKIHTFKFLSMKVQVVVPEKYMSVLMIMSRVSYKDAHCFYKNQMIYLSKDFLNFRQEDKND